MASKIALLASKAVILGTKIGFYSLPTRFSAALGPHLHFFMGLKVDFGWILLARGSEIEVFPWYNPMLLGSLHLHCQAQTLLAKYAKNLGKTEVFTIIYPC